VGRECTDTDTLGGVVSCVESTGDRNVFAIHSDEWRSGLTLGVLPTLSGHLLCIGYVVRGHLEKPDFSVEESPHVTHPT
jgi:hypothetical protein